MKKCKFCCGTGILWNDVNCNICNGTGKVKRELNFVKIIAKVIITIIGIYVLSIFYQAYKTNTPIILKPSIYHGKKN